MPREGEPAVATFKLNNPIPQATGVEYQFYANGELMKRGETVIPPDSSKVYQYAYENPLELGEQVSFAVRVTTPQGDYEKVVSIPSYPPQIWSSFVSFASFSTSVMSSMSTMTYYRVTFGTDMGLNVGIIAAIVVITLLIFMELTQTVVEGKVIARLGRLRLRFSTVTWILFIIFMGMVYTKVVMLLIGRR